MPSNLIDITEIAELSTYVCHEGYKTFDKLQEERNYNSPNVSVLNFYS